MIECSNLKSFSHPILSQKSDEVTVTCFMSAFICLCVNFSPKCRMARSRAFLSKIPHPKPLGFLHSHISENINFSVLEETIPTNLLGKACRVELPPYLSRCCTIARRVCDMFFVCSL